MRQVVPVEPSSFGELRALQVNLAVVVVGCETYHESARVGPRLRTEVAQVGNVEACFLHDFAVNRFFQCLARLYKSGNESVVVVAETVGVNEENFQQSAKFESVNMQTREMQFLYADGGIYYFMDMESYEQVEVSEELIGENANTGTMTNTHSDITPTGLVINNAPFIVMIGAAAAGVVAYGSAKRKLEK